MNLGEQIYKLRTQRNLSQGDLAEQLEVSRQSVSKWENNSAVPELDKLIKMSQIFGVTLDSLVAGEAGAGSAPAAAPAQSPRFSACKITGCFLLGFGLLAFVMLLIAAMFQNDLLLLALYALPLILSGILCLRSKPNAAFITGVLLYLIIWTSITLFSYFTH